MAKVIQKSVKELKVSLRFDEHTIPVGRLAIRDYQIYFEYYNSFVAEGLEISPFKLPLKTGLKVFDKTPFEGLAGVFSDSLPDGWGRLLFDRFFKSKQIVPETLSPLDRLAYVGKTGMGVLVYEPDHKFLDSNEKDLNVDQFYEQSQKILQGKASSVLREMIKFNGSSAGARPKALIGVNSNKTKIVSNQENLPEGFEPWIVKFPNSFDGNDAGAIEYVYALMAKEAGVEMSPVHLFESAKCPGYFATERFDRKGKQRLHMHTAGGLLHSDFRYPSLDYKDLITLTGVLTKDVREVEKMYRLAVFNILSHNRDDHAKNFAFLMNKQGQWKLAPAYDLTFSSGPGGQQSTMLMGEGQYPNTKGLISLGEFAKLKKQAIDDIISATKQALSQWTNLAKNFDVNADNIKLINSKIKLIEEP